MAILTASGRAVARRRSRNKPCTSPPGKAIPCGTPSRRSMLHLTRQRVTLGFTYLADIHVTSLDGQTTYSLDGDATAPTLAKASSGDSPPAPFPNRVRSSFTSKSNIPPRPSPRPPCSGKSVAGWSMKCTLSPPIRTAKSSCRPRRYRLSTDDQPPRFIRVRFDFEDAATQCRARTGPLRRHPSRSGMRIGQKFFIPAQITAPGFSWCCSTLGAHRAPAQHPRDLPNSSSPFSFTGPP